MRGMAGSRRGSGRVAQPKVFRRSAGVNARIGILLVLTVFPDLCLGQARTGGRTMSENNFPMTLMLAASVASALVWLMAMVQAMPGY